MKKKLQFPEKVNSAITPLHISGLSGRMLQLKHSTKPTEILFIYGHHASLERYFGIVEDLSQYGTVTMPDLPGFGGMDSFYKIDEEPTLDAFADYLAAFIKYRYKKKQFAVAAMSLGFGLVTRMLQRYPEIANQVTLVVSVVGFSHYEDFSFTKLRMFSYKTSTALFKRRFPALAFRYIALNQYCIRYAYRHTKNAKAKFKRVSKKAIEKTIQMEISLWQSNEVRTYMSTANMMLKIDLTGQKISLPLHHISVGKSDQYFNEPVVEQHLKCIYEDVIIYPASLDTHAPTVIATAEEAKSLFPKKLRTVLSSLENSK